MFKKQRSTRRRRQPLLTQLLRGVQCHWLRPTGLLALLGLTLTGSSSLPITSLTVAIAQPQKVVPAPQAQAPGAQSPFEWPIRLINESQQAYTNIQTYHCIMISQERVAGKLLPEQVIDFTFRKNPFSVYMKWLSPKDKTSQEVCYVQGRNQNKIRAKQGLPVWVSIDIDAPAVKQNSRHVITEAGFGNLIERCARSWDQERNMGMTRVQVAEYEYNQRRCYRIETTHTMQDRSFYCYRNVVYFDKETRFPVRMESYDWPRAGGPPEGELLECFSYINLNFNVPISEAVFSH
jgi:hypothetical protein